VALAWIVLLDFVVLATVIKFWTVHRMGAVLLVPYWTWLLFATALNASIAVMNS
jgi:benzodiazapine receptor